MTRKSKGIVELVWTCPNCESRNRGSEKTCVNCGAPQPDDVQFEAPGDRKFVDEGKASELRKRGADIHCGFCGTRNPSDAKTCSQCGADLSEGVARDSGREIQPAAGPQTVVCGNCGAENPAAKVNCAECGAPLPRQEQPAKLAGVAGSKAAAAPTPTPVAPGATKKKPNWLVLGGIAAGLLVCCVVAVFVFAFPSQSLQATVNDVYWQTAVPVQEIREVRHTNERGNPPSDAYNVSCQTESREVCQEKTIDRGDGYAEVVEDCRTESDQYCDYAVDEWTTIQTLTLDGHDLYPVYQQANLASGQRIGTQSEDFTVYFSTENGIIDYSPDDLSEYQQFQPGSSWTLKLNALGGVVDVAR